MTLLTKLYVHVQNGSTLDVAALYAAGCAERVDFIHLANGDSVGVVMATSADARKKMGAVPGITVLPPYHRQVGASAATTFGAAGALPTDTTYDVAEKLTATYGMPWFDPENGG